ncbi:hypothetical protein BLNAU_21425 [Blattamonas nauphoetae]|uniref:Uncharacterized protein n=1 Tax=Blattamonas nauphoetae TaxID=2049346 RepID=A0ABQ9WVX1_9EUKA|nr:hypothetical protein BLNAU_21425 [Blattamonas nauphoetae]
MTAIDKKTDNSSAPTRSDLPSRLFQFSTDCLPFLNWSEEDHESEHETAVIFQSLVATVKLQPALDDSLERKAVRFLESVSTRARSSADAFLNSLASSSDNSSPDFVQSIVVLISSPCLAIIKAAMEILQILFIHGSAKSRLALVSADLIPQLFTSLNPQSLSFSEAFNIHINLMKIIRTSLCLATPGSFASLGIQEGNGQQYDPETVLKQVLAPSEEYICHLYVNRFSIIDGDQSYYYLLILAKLLEICPSYQPTMAVIGNMPVFLATPSSLTFFEGERSICFFWDLMVDAQREWNNKSGEVRKKGKTVHRLLRMEGFEDVIEEKMQNDKKERGRWIVDDSIKWNNLLGMNLPQRG